MNFEKMLKEFDWLITDSENRVISIYKNPNLEHFIILCQEELKKPEAYEILKAHILENEEIFLAHMGCEDEKELTVDTAILKLHNA